jgi:hypothetical protein
MDGSSELSRQQYHRRGFCALAGSFLFATGCTSFFGRGATPLAQETIPPLPEAPTLPGKADPLRVSQYVFYSDVPLNANAPLFKELSELRDQVVRELKLPPSSRIVQVYLFENSERYERFMKSNYPKLPRRRAFFIEQERAGGGPSDLLVFTIWGREIRQDLRHELTHAILHASLKNVPLWLDEGIAEFYEQLPEKDGLNIAHLEAVRKGIKPELASLEKITKVDDMGRPQYQEAWAWVHLMLRSNAETKNVLVEYLRAIQGLREDQTPTLHVKLKELYQARPETILEKHLQALENSAKIRLED